MTSRIKFRIFDGPLNNDIHQHMQLVMLLDGGFELEVHGRGARLDRTRAAFIEPGVVHSQFAGGHNRAAILDCDMSEIDPDAAELLSRRTFLTISPATRRLIEFADLSLGQGVPQKDFFPHWIPLLVNSLLTSSAPPSTRVSMLQALFEESPAALPSVGAMARRAGLSPSRLHAVFMSELRQSPQNWLSEQRVLKAQEMLAHTNIPIADLALHLGYSDQSALTKAMRRMTGQSPAAYRRQQRSQE